MRIVAGEFRSRAIVAPKGDATRPTTDRARESLFNVLTNLIDFEGRNVLDLFAGSGALGLEALSRGALHVTFVERDRHALDALSRNIDALKIGDRTTIVKGDVFKSVSSLVGGFDLVLADAPYAETRAREELPNLLFDSKAVAEEGMAVIEHRYTDSVTVPDGVQVVRVVSAGEVGFTLLKRVGSTGS